jgi:hypothetical protein
LTEEVPTITFFILLEAENPVEIGFFLLNGRLIDKKSNLRYSLKNKKGKSSFLRSEGIPLFSRT